MTLSASTQENRELVVRAITGTFVRRDTSVPALLFADDYIQHNPGIANGSAALPGLIAGLVPEFKYEMGMVVADGDLVMIHGRYTGWGPKPMVAVDIFRVAGGKIVEHWDVLQEEVPAEATVTGNPMFTVPGTSGATRSA